MEIMAAGVHHAAVEGITVLDVPKLQTGVIAEIKGDKSGPVIAVRADSSCFLSFNKKAVPRIDAVWKSWPQACITPLFRDAKQRRDARLRP
jgi:hypothetical protein